ncbi:YgaP family membrane protein [Pseudoalteromonas denitrificans]|uniref:Inner membrane protein YgaP-like transmembrane domain-containing protein n=1 Tax=Pseudoalteromonas denitrificans DSM 6059 TaxID=1123010 RepID=A0A1I1RJZ7_9GAMM|nr:DUF2892 domain-containing protein [Pseudoalteromonas denitrificans]SFD34357.1 Protein of unknown function [Pseudoalteromonas denitrificans DSM 6059]
MLYVKNLPTWKRIIRVVAGLAMVTCGAHYGLQGLPLGYLIGGVGIITALTGFIGFCPMCSFAVRKQKK